MKRRFILGMFVCIAIVFIWNSVAAQEGEWLTPDIPFNGSIASTDEVDTWLFDGTGAATVHVSVTPTTDSILSPVIMLYDAEDNLVTEGNAMLETRLPATSTYRLLVSGAEGTTGSYEILLRVVDAPTANPLPTINATSTFIPPTLTPEGMDPSTFIPSGPLPGIPIEIGQTVTDHLTIGRWDIWEFEGEASQHITIRLRSNEFDPFLELYSPIDEHIPLFTDDDSGRGRNATLYDIVLPQTGHYRIFARSYDNLGEGAYTLSLEPGLGFPPTIEQSLPIQYNELLAGTLDSEEVYYYFRGSAGDQVSVLLSSTSFDSYLEFLDIDGNILDENDDDGRGQNAAIVNFQLPADGVYFITVTSYVFDAQGPYMLELLITDPMASPLVGEIEVGQTVSRRLLPTTIHEWHFWGTAGQVISISAVPVDPNELLDMVMEIVAPGGQRFTDDDGGYQRNPALTDLRLPESGRYTVYLREYNATIGGAYYLSLAEGRTYFSPAGQPGRYVPIMNDDSIAILDTLHNPEDTYSLWVVVVPPEQYLSLTLLTGNGGEGLPQDFQIELMDIIWADVAESSMGSLYTENVMPIATEYLILIHYRGPGQQTYQLQFQTSTTDPATVATESARGDLQVDIPITSTLPRAERHTWRFTAPEAGSYSVILTSTNEDQVYDPYLYVYNAENQLLAEDDDSAGGFNPRIIVQLEAEQQMIIEASSFGDLSGGDYQLVVTRNE